MHLRIIVGDRCPRPLRVAIEQPIWGEAVREVMNKYFSRKPTEAELPILKPMEAFGGSFVQVSGTIQLDAEGCKRMYSGHFHPARDCAEAVRQIFCERLGPDEDAGLHVNILVITHGETGNVEDHFISQTSIKSLKAEPSLV